MRGRHAAIAASPSRQSRGATRCRLAGPPGRCAGLERGDRLNSTGHGRSPPAPVPGGRQGASVDRSCAQPQPRAAAAATATFWLARAGSPRQPWLGFSERPAQLGPVQPPPPPASPAPTRSPAARRLLLDRVLGFAHLRPAPARAPPPRPPVCPPGPPPAFAPCQGATGRRGRPCNASLPSAGAIRRAFAACLRCSRAVANARTTAPRHAQHRCQQTCLQAATYVPNMPTPVTPLCPCAPLFARVAVVCDQPGMGRLEFKRNATCRHRPRPPSHSESPTPRPLPSRV